MLARNITVAISFLVVVVALMQLTAKEGPSIQEQYPPWHRVNVKGAKEWFSLQELKAAADAHLKKRVPGIDLDKFLVTAFIESRGKSRLVTLQYFEKLTLPVYSIGFDRHGDITLFKEDVAREGRTKFPGNRRDEQQKKEPEM